MPITWRMSRNWVDVKFSDPYTLPESESVMKEIFAQPAVPRPLRFLVDVRSSTPPDMEFVSSAITFWQLHIDKMWGAKIAIVTGTEKQARMAHVSEMTAESRELPFTLRVFDQSEWADAEQWLELDEARNPHQS
jgi:hypothetical protein